MCERVFPSEEGRRDEWATELAAGLAERIQEEISRRNHDWAAIARDTESLARLAAGMAWRS
ncbi:MAG TPA: hypothetical protein VHV75_10630 [Solirubrobacteraceae bacterium]|jgi:hypothetical protein|nr:hypothetical protein [Solirubrobacteraceae bacterium]